MKLNNIILAITAGAVLSGASSCKNADKTFPDSDAGVNVYFAYQYPIRTIILGDLATFDNTADNEHRFQIYSTMGGSYKGRNIDVEVKVDESLLDNLRLDDGTPNGAEIKALPSNLYTLSGTTIHYNGGYNGCVDVQLADAFFTDPKAVDEYYVIPLVITQQTGADGILTGTPIEGGSQIRQNMADWRILPQDYVLYMINYINKFDGNYLRRGVDDITTSAGTFKRVRHAQFVESDSVVKVTTKSLTTAVLPVKVVKGGTPFTCDLLLTFSGDNCTISSATNGVTVTGSGEFKSKSEKKAWGDKDRDGLYLKYTIDLGDTKYSSTDTLVARDRGAAASNRQFYVKYIK